MNCSLCASTREYAPKYALRSYFYLLPSVGAAKASQAFLSLFGQGADKPQVKDMLSSRLLMRDYALCRFGRGVSGAVVLVSSARRNTTVWCAHGFVTVKNER